MSHPPPPPAPDGFRDRRIGLILSGAIEILIGLGCAALVPLTLIAVSISPSLDMRIVLPSLVLYAAVGAVFITLGVGSIQARRWAAALSLSLAWVWLITGVCTLLVLWMVLPTLWLDLAAASGLDDRTAGWVALVINAILGVIYVLIPGAFVLFYRSPHVIATCRAKHPDPGGIGGCPQPLLGLSVAYALAGLSILAVPSYGFVFPFFGLLLSGAPGAVCWAGVLLLSLALVYGTFRRQPWAWWTAMTASVAAAVSSVATFARTDAATVFDAMALPPDQLLLLEHLWPREAWVHTVVWLVVWGSLAGYLLVVRRYFDFPGHNSEQ